MLKYEASLSEKALIERGFLSLKRRADDSSMQTTTKYTGGVQWWRCVQHSSGN
jgi:hypothetical protein